MEFTENEKDIIKSIKITDMHKINKIKKEPLWKLNLIFTDFEILFRNGKPLKWFTFKKAAPIDIDGDIIICRKRFHKYNRKKNSVTRYEIYVDVMHKYYSVVRKNTFYKGILKDKNGNNGELFTSKSKDRIYYVTVEIKEHGKSEVLGTYTSTMQTGAEAE